VSQHSDELIYPNVWHTFSWLLLISKFSISEVHAEIMHGTLAVEKPLSPDTSLKMLTEHLQNTNNRSIWQYDLLENETVLKMWI